MFCRKLIEDVLVTFEFLCLKKETWLRDEM
jgi:hypothetical protein